MKKDASIEDAAVKEQYAAFPCCEHDVLVVCILGIFPLTIFAAGAGHVSQNSLGISLIGGLLCVLLAGTFLIPGFYAFVQRKREKAHGGNQY
ncbi:hypothetical protein O9992_20100 [Vibrio lentus]|nr:hypothetical protein [Vibrio lentus]